MLDEAAKKTVLRLFTYGLYAVSVCDGDEVNAFTANWICQASFEPPMVMVAVENDGRSIEMMRRAGMFGVSVYETGQRDLAGHFGRRSSTNPDKLAGQSWEPGETGAPLLTEALGHLECRVLGELPAGDHTVFVGEVVQAHVRREGEPLTQRETGFRYFG
jgi:flavin reductase (DIM6/NTAB) family NADH-FMN oxidoreductase RutF